ncbi:ABC transporter ATP-binding protein [Paenibacillus endoradicis]|uniref:ABC transporter ATP-binding protein n=1 Tax=Paenibacillus endoradicis TaxID=2972487 RepID=UPI0021597E60|nr:ABC transporter ATP-binding protein [Paenibacillus endoradicis]MCR8659514.1 ABC transporter ATP-binding protein [Paenibacillus endoradicis]
MMESIIELRKVSKSFSKEHMVLDEITIKLFKNQCIAILGQNGSGKSTILKLIASLIPCSSGEIIYDKDSKIGYAPEQFPKLKFTAEEYLYAMGRIQKLPKYELKQKINDLLYRFNLHESYDMTHFSKGMLQKVNLLQAVLGDPRVLILDEPLSGLDASSRIELITMLQIFKDQGITIIMSCHENSLLDELADRVIVIKDGKVHSDNPIKQVNESLFKIVYANDGDVPICNLLNPKLILTYNNGNELIVKEQYRDSVLLQLLQQNYSIISVTKEIQRKSILELTGYNRKGDSI